MSFSEDQIPNNLQELLSTLLKLSKADTSGGSTVIKLGNELVSFNISKLPESSYNNLNSLNNTLQTKPTLEPLKVSVKEELNLQYIMSKDTFQESPSPKSLNQQNSGSLYTADFNQPEPEIDYNGKESPPEENLKFGDEQEKEVEFDKEDEGKGFGGFDNFTFINDMSTSFGRQSMIPRRKISHESKEIRSEENEIVELRFDQEKTMDENEKEKKSLQNENNNLYEDKTPKKEEENKQNFLNEQKKNEESKSFVETKIEIKPEIQQNINKSPESKQKLGEPNKEKESEQIKSGLDFIMNFQSGKFGNPDFPSSKKTFSTNFLNDINMNNIPVSNKINPYAIINVFSSQKTPEIINPKLPDEVKFLKKTSNETENASKNNNITGSPNKLKKPLVQNQPPMLKIPNNPSLIKPGPTANPNYPATKKKINLPAMKPNFLKKNVVPKNIGKGSTIKEVNEDAHSNEDSKSLKEKQGNVELAHKSSYDMEKPLLKAKDSKEEEENTKKSMPKSIQDLNSTAIDEESKKTKNTSKILDDKRPKTPKEPIKMELPEIEMEENLKFLMEKADRNDAMGEKMFQTINSLLKYKQQLETKEKTLKEKEKVFVEWEQKSKSSTQWSYDTKSTLNGTDPIKSILEEFYKEKKNEFYNYEPPSEADIHFLFLYSSPLITFFRDKEGKIGKRPIHNEIDIVNEWKTVQEILPESKREIKFMKTSASLEKIGVVFDRNPMAIHFCGHGVKNTEENFGMGSNEEVGDFLIFEDQFGGADFVSCMTLSKLLNKLKNKLQFAFVASCHSKFLGEVFLNAGALHVICVKREEKILDKACQIFTKAFYNSCFTGKKTICEAFEIAKEQIRANASLPKGEENKFVMLIKQYNNQSIFDEHKCQGWVDLRPGSFQDLSWKPEFNHLPSQVENFVGRNEIMHEVITQILTYRFITIKGIPGIGKSSLAKEVGRYIYDRNHFKNGIIYLQLISCQTNEAVTSCLESKVFPNSSFKQIESKKENTLKMLYQIIDNLRNKEVLIIMDNVDMVLSTFSEKEKFQSTIDYLLSSCNTLKLLVTSRTPVGGGSLADCVERLYNLSQLNNEDAKNLFLLRSPRPISSQEISDLLFLIPTENYIAEDKNIKPKENTFSNHQFMELFGGHPQAITLGAALLYERSLKDLYNYLQSNSIVNVLHLDPYLSDREKKTFNSLKASLDASWAILYEKNKNAAKFFSVLGLLPGGASEEEFQEIWGDNWQEYCDVLLRSSLLVKTQRNDSAFYSLFPFMTKYAEEHINMKDKKEFHYKIMEYYHKKMQRIFKMIGTLSTESSKAVDDLQDIEFNVRAGIFRELSFQGSKELEKSLYENYSTLNMASTDNLKSASESLNNNKNLQNPTEIIKEDDDFVPLTKENLEIHQKRYEFITTSKLISNNTSKKSQRSASPICINENLANYLKSPSKNKEQKNKNKEEKSKNKEEKSKNNDDSKNNIDTSKNNEDDSDKKNNESNIVKTASISDEENTKQSPNNELKNSKDFKKKRFESRLAVVPRNTEAEIPNTFVKLSFEENKEEIHESVSQSSTPKFSKILEVAANIDEMILEKNVPLQTNDDKTNENEKNMNNNEDIALVQVDENSNANNKHIDLKNDFSEKIIDTGKNIPIINIDKIVVIKNEIEKSETPNNSQILSNSKSKVEDLTINTNFDKTTERDKTPNSTNTNTTKKTPTVKETKDKKPVINKSSISSTRPSNSLTNPENQPKIKTNPKTSIIKPKNSMTKTNANSPFPDKTKVALINKILIYYSSTLFLLRRYNECNKMINHGLQLSDKMNDKLAFANFKRISGSVQYIKKNFQQALKEFLEAEDIFKEIGCSLGVSIAEAAIGYIKYCEGEYSQAKNYLEAALKIYDSLNNVFGIHFMNRWLANVKRKIPGFTTQTKKHIEAAQKILRDKNKVPSSKGKEKNNLAVQSQHKGGCFILRWLGDGISIFMEVAFKIDIEGKKVKNKSSIITTRPTQISASEDNMFKSELQIPSLVKSESQKKSQPNKTKKGKEEEKTEKKEEKNVVNRPAVLKKKK